MFPSNHINPPLRSSLTVTVSPIVSPLRADHRPSRTLPDVDNFKDLPEPLRDDITQHVVLVQLDKGVAGLGFCIEGGKQSPTGDRPVRVRRIFRCMYLTTSRFLHNVVWFVVRIIRPTYTGCSRKNVQTLKHHSFALMCHRVMCFFSERELTFTFAICYSSGRQPNFAALNRGRHLCSAGRPSHWALIHF